MGSGIQARVAAIALAGLGCFGFSSAAGALNYQLLDAELPNCKGACPKVIYASGTIQQNEYLNFTAFVQEAMARGKISQVVLIDSPGGFLGGAASLGLVMRKLKMRVMVGRPAGGVLTAQSGLTAGTCASACPLVLMGGVKRTYVPGSRIGVHRSHTGRDVLDPTTRQKVNGTPDYQAANAAYDRYFRMMGVDPALAKLIDSTPSETMRWLSADELKRYRLADGASTTN